MTELAIAQAFQSSFQGLSIFADADVVINDFSVYDQWIGKSPYLILSTSDTFESRQDTKAAQTRWDLGATLVVLWEGWKTALDNLMSYRQDCIDLVNSGSVRVAGASGVDVPVIRSASKILPWFYPYQENDANAEPLFIFQEWIIESQEF